MSLITDLADAITRQEGGNPANNNPGNLMDEYRKIWPQYPHANNNDAKAPVIFPNAAAGRAALENDLSIKVNRGMTLTSLLTMYAPPSQNDTATYIRNVSTWTGIPTDAPLNQLEQFQPTAQPGELVAYDPPDLSFSDVSGPQDASTAQADVFPGPVSPAMLFGLLIGGLILYFLVED